MCPRCMFTLLTPRIRRSTWEINSKKWRTCKRIKIHLRDYIEKSFLKLQCSLLITRRWFLLALICLPLWERSSAFVLCFWFSFFFFFLHKSWVVGVQSREQNSIDFDIPTWCTNAWWRSLQYKETLLREITRCMGEKCLIITKPITQSIRSASLGVLLNN